MGNVSDKSCRENQNTHYVLSNFFFLENRASYEIMWKNNVERGKPQMTIWRTACFSNGARHIVFCGLRLQIHIHTHTHTLRLCNTNCFSIATMVPRTRLNITFYVHCLVLKQFGHQHARKQISGTRVTYDRKQRHIENSLLFLRKSSYAKP